MKKKRKKKSKKQKDEKRASEIQEMSKCPMNFHSYTFDRRVLVEVANFDPV